jgi:hypothetical protein
LGDTKRLSSLIFIDRGIPMLATQTTTVAPLRAGPLRWLSGIFTTPLTASCQYCGARKLKTAMVAKEALGFYCSEEEAEQDWQGR